MPTMPTPASTITIVSGLPRSGTSVMMQMLEAGGLPPLTDHVRTPDDDNPRGYYEFERVKKIKEDNAWLDDCAGKVVKMVSMLLYDLPPDRAYRVVFMRRSLPEVLASQKKMLARLGRDGAGVGDEVMAANFEKHLAAMEQWLGGQPNIEVIYVDHHDVIMCPADTAAKVNAFLGGGLDETRMAAVVDQSLYRQRNR